MKRILICLSILCLAIASSIAIVSCSRKPASETSGKVITLCCWGSPDEINILKEGLKRFEGIHPDIKVMLMQVLVQHYQAKLLIMFAGGTSPDVMYLLSDRIAGFVSKGALMDLTSRIQRDDRINLKEFPLTALKLSKYKDKYYSLPLYVSPLVLHYNKDLFDVEGISYPDETWTWEDFLEAAKRLTKDLNGDGRIDQYGFMCSLGDPNRFCPFILQNGGKLGEEGGGYWYLNPATLNEAIEALQFYLDLVYKHGVAPRSSVLRTIGIDSTGGFIRSTIAMHITGVWDTIEFNRKIKNFQWDISVLPYHKKRGTTLIGASIGISKTCRDPESAWELVSFLVGEMIEKRCMPPFKSAKVQKEYFNSVGLGSKNYPAFIDSVEYAEFLPPVISGDVKKLFSQETMLMWIGKEPVRPVLERLVRKIEAARQECRP